MTAGLYPALVVVLFLFDLEAVAEVLDRRQRPSFVCRLTNYNAKQCQRPSALRCASSDEEAVGHAGPCIGPGMRSCWPELDDGRWQKLEDFATEVAEVNQYINVISRKDIVNVVSNHLLAALGPARLLASAPKGTRVLDIGTGGGFPGIPVAIVCPQLKLTLVDSTGKKIRAVQEMADSLGLRNVETVHARVEDLVGRFDYVIGRSVTAVPRFLAWAAPKLKTVEKPKEEGDGGISQLPAPGVLYISGVLVDDEDSEGVATPTKVYDIQELVRAYEGDKAVLHYDARELRGLRLVDGDRGEQRQERRRGPLRKVYDDKGRFRPERQAKASDRGIRPRSRADGYERSNGEDSGRRGDLGERRTFGNSRNDRSDQDYRGDRPQRDSNGGYPQRRRNASYGSDGMTRSGSYRGGRNGGAGTQRHDEGRGHTQRRRGDGDYSDNSGPRGGRRGEGGPADGGWSKGRKSE